MGGTESGARGEKEQTSCRREKVKGGYFGHELFSKTSLFPSSCRCLFTLAWHLFRPQKSTATVAQVPKESLSLLTSFYLPSASLLSFSISVSPSSFFSSAASSKCLQITQLWNSTLHLYLCLLGQYASCGLRFCSVADKKKSS